MSLLVHKNRANHPEVIQPKPMGAILRMNAHFRKAQLVSPFFPTVNPTQSALASRTPCYYGHPAITDTSILLTENHT